VRCANQLPEQIERLIVDTKKDKPHWGARKIRELLARRLAGDVRIPARSTVHAVLDRHGLMKRARLRRRPPCPALPCTAAALHQTMPQGLPPTDGNVARFLWVG
jgi:hypothetical protein